MRELYEDFLILQEQDKQIERHTYNYEDVSRAQHNLQAILGELSKNKLTSLTLDDLQELVDDVVFELKLSRKIVAARRAVEETIRLTTDKEFTLQLVESLAWRLAGNKHRLGEGLSVLPWRSSMQDTEWCAVLVEGVKYPTYHAGTTRRGFTAWYFVMSGAPAGRTVERWHESGREFFIAKQLGFSERDAEMLYHNELVGCQAHALLRPNSDESRPPFIKQFHVTARQQRYNHKLYEERCRKPCPKGLRPKPYRGCRDCVAGFDLAIRGDAQYCPMAVQRLPRKEDDARTASENTGGPEVVCAGTGPDLLYPRSYQVDVGAAGK